MTWFALLWWIPIWFVVSAFGAWVGYVVGSWSYRRGQEAARKHFEEIMKKRV